MSTEQLIDYLKKFMSPERVEKVDRIIDDRTRHVTILLENLYQSQNASAVLRSAECLGIQDIHVVENNNQFEVHPDIALGSSKWLTIHQYNQEENNTLTAIQNLKKQGYRVLATMPNQNDCMIDDVDLSVPTAFMFGTELTGLSEEAIALADGYVKIPMYGFTESFNISVSAAILMNVVAKRLRESDIPWQLSPLQRDEIMLDWCRKSLKTPDMIIKRFRSNNLD
jgi:tRNA (guanosine-2'-O-)-methyltransferase